MSAEPRPIALVGPYSPFRGGIARFTDRAAVALETAGNRVLRVSFSRQYPNWLYPGSGQIEPNVQPAHDSARWVDGFGPWSWRRAAGKIAQLNPEGVVLPYWTPALAPAIGSVGRGLRRRGVRTVGLLHNMLPHERMPAERALGRWVLGGLDAALALSEGVAEDARSLGFRGPLRVTSHPPYDGFGPMPSRAASRQRLGLPESGTVLLCFGLVRRYKGVDVLIESLPAVLHEHPDARLVVAGEWFEDASRIRARIDELDLSERVRIDDRYIPDDEVPSFFAAADLLVQPYRKATQSGVLGIAAGYGLPAVVTDVGSLASDLHAVRGGVVVPAEDPAALANGICRALTELESLKSAVRTPSGAAWDAFASAVIDLIRS